MRGEICAPGNRGQGSDWWSEKGGEDVQRDAETQRQKGGGGLRGERSRDPKRTQPWGSWCFLGFPGNWWISVPYDRSILSETLINL